MAGYDTTRLGKGARYRAQTVGALTALIFCLVWSGAALAAYSVITKGGPLAADCYHIQGNRLILCSGKELNLQDVIDVDTSALTAQEKRERTAAMAEFSQRIDVLTQEDARIQALESKNREVLEYIAGLRSSNKTESRLGDALDDAFLMLDQLQMAAGAQKQAWEHVRIPELLLLPLRELKILQYSVRILSYQEWRQYLKQGDITLREYAREHYRRVGVFEERFQARLVKMRTTAASAAPQAAEVPGDEFWKESAAPEPIIIPKIP